MAYKQVIAVRDDLDLSPGKLAVQVAHGAVAAACSAKQDADDWYQGWRDDAQMKVCVRVDGADTLRELEGIASTQGLPCHLVRDAGRTEIPQGTLTALALGPAPAEKIDPLTGDLSLL